MNARIFSHGRIRKSAVLFFFLLLSTLTLRSANYYWVGGTGDWSDYGAHWATASGGQVFHIQVPTPYDTVHFDSLSFSGPNDTVYCDSSMLYCAKMVWSNLAQHPVFASRYYSSGNIIRIYGSLQLDTGMTWAYNGQLWFEALDTANTVACAGHSFPYVEFRGDSAADWTLLDTMRTHQLIFRSGIFHANGQTIICHRVRNTVANKASVLLDSSCVIVGDSAVFDLNILLLDADSATFIMNGTHFFGGSHAFGTLLLNGAIILYDDNSIRKAVFQRYAQIYGSNTFDTLIWNGGGYVLSLMNGSTQTITDSLLLNGSCAGMTTVEAIHMGNPAMISKAGGAINCDYVVLEDIDANGGATFTASNSLALGNTSGWNFISTPAPRNLWWVNGTGSWSDTSHWSLSSGGAGGNCAPNLQDNVYFDNNGLGGSDTVTVDSFIAYCEDFDASALSNFSAVLQFPFAANLAVRTFGSLRLSAQMQCGPGNFMFRSLLPGRTIDPAGHTLGHLAFYNYGSWSLLSPLNASGLQNICGDFFSNSQPLNAGYMHSWNHYPKSMILGASAISTSLWWLEGGNLLLDADSTTISMSGEKFLDVDPNVYNDVSFGNSAHLFTSCTFDDVTVNGSAEIFGNNTFGDLTFNSAGKMIRLAPGSLQVLNGSMTVNANCAAYAGIESMKPGVQAGFDKTSGSITISDVIMQDVSAVGGATFSALNSVAVTNVSGWNVTPPPTGDFYWIGGSGDWSDPQHWSMSSGGAPGACVPTPLNNVNFDALSFSGPNDLVNVDVENAYCKSMDWTGSTGTPQLTRASFTHALKIYGSLTLDSTVSFQPGMTKFRSPLPGNTVSTFGQSPGFVRFEGVGGEWTLQNQFSADSIHVENGAFFSNGYDFDCLTFRSDSLSLRSIHLDSSRISAAHWIIAETSQLTLDADSAEITMTGREFNGGGGQTYHQLSFSADGLISNSDTIHFARFTRMIEILQSNTFDTLFFDNPGRQAVLAAGTVQTVRQKLAAGGGPSASVALESHLAGQAAQLVKSSDTVCLNYINMRDVHASGGAVFFAGNYSSDLGNNAGWIFQDCHPLMSDVWPGDANDDLTADNFDILAIGVAYGHSGAARPNASNNWTAQPCIDWNAMFASTANVKHADCDGDGIVGQSDTTAVSLNYGQTHPPRLAAPDSVQMIGPALYFDAPTTPVPAGSTLTIPIMLGTQQDPAANIYGVAFTINYNTACVLPGVTTSYANSWLCPPGNNVHLEKYFLNNLSFEHGFSRIDHQNASGSGEIANFTFTLDPSVTGIIKFWFTSFKVITKDEIEVPVTPLAGIFSVVVVGMDEPGPDNELLVYPNPSGGEFSIGDGRLDGVKTEITIMNTGGQLVHREVTNGIASRRFDLSAQPKGLYFVKAKNERGVFVSKIMIR